MTTRLRRSRRLPHLAAAALMLCPLAVLSVAEEPPDPHPVHDHSHGTRPAPRSRTNTSLANVGFRWPGWAKVRRVLALRDYNVRIVIFGTILLGIGAGTVGSFMLLRKRSLVGDVVSHASLPGIAVAFLAVEVVSPGTERSLPILLLGALVAGLLGVLLTMVITRFSRIKQDAALAIVLSVFFGVGIAMFTIIQKLPTGQVAGLQRFIYGQTASMILADVKLIATGSLAVLVLSALFFKEFGLLCFDEDFAGSLGWPTLRLDFVLMSMVVTIAIVGLQSVGMLLIVALLIIPAAAARFWTERLGPMTMIAAGLGGLSAWLGAVVSSLFARFSAGAVIVLVGSLFFMISLAFGARRGVVLRWMLQASTRRQVGRHDLLRTLYEICEPDLEPTPHGPDPLCGRPVSRSELLSRRSWSPRRLTRLLKAAIREGHLAFDGGAFVLSTEGARQARQVARNHRLWEEYLIRHADIAPSHVDRDADMIEHVLGADLVEELLASLAKQYPAMEMPPSPHPLEAST